MLTQTPKVNGDISLVHFLMKETISHTKEESTKVLDQLIQGLVDLYESFAPLINIKLAEIILKQLKEPK